MKNSCLWSFVLATCALPIAGAAAVAQSSTPPTAQQTLHAQLETLKNVPLWCWIAGAGFAFIVLIVVAGVAVARKTQVRVEEERYRAIANRKKLLLKQAHAAIALSLATDNFSRAACWDAAHDAREAILKRRNAIEDTEAARRLNRNQREEEYNEIAVCASETCDLSRDEVIEILRNADAWEYRVLREAELQNERRVTHARPETTSPSLRR